MNALTVTFNCPICGTEQTHESAASPAPDETHLCSNCRNDYFLLAVRGKETTQSELENRINEQLTSVSKLHEIAHNHPKAVRELSYGPIYGLTALVGVIGGTTMNALLLTAMFLTLPQTPLFWVIAGVLVVQSGIGIVGGALGPLRFLYYGPWLYRKYELDMSFREFIEHVGNYHNKRLYEFES